MRIWKDNKGEKIDAKEFAKRFKEGISNITPLQRLQNEQRATFIMLVGYLVGLVSLIVFRDKFVVSWFTYALMIIFVGAAYGQVIKFLALRTQLKLFENLGEQSLDLDKVLSSLEEVPEEKIEVVDGERKGMGDMGMKVEDYIDEKHKTNNNRE